MRLARVEPALDAVEARHQHRGEGEVRVRRGVRAAELDPLRLRRVAVHRDADAGAAVAGRVREVDRRLVARHQAAVRVRGGSAEREQRGRMRQQAGDVGARELREPGRPGLVGEERRAFGPERLMAVHARAVVAEDRLRHERRRLAGGAGRVLDDVLVGHDLVGHPRQRLEAEVDLALAAGGHLVVVELARDAQPLEGEHHPGAQVVQRVVRRGREVALLLADRVAEPRLAGVPVALGRVDAVAGLVRTARVRDLVEDEELALGADVARVGDAARAQVLLRPPRDTARVLGVRLLRHRIGDLADERERRGLGERVEDGRRRVGHQQHVALRDPLPAADRGAVEAEPLVEGGLVEPGDRQRDVLPGAEQIAELEVDHRRTRLARPLERRPRLDLARQVVPQLLLDLRHAAPSCAGPTKKPHDSQES